VFTIRVSAAEATFKKQFSDGLLEPLGEDFLGADPGELYQRLFEVEKSDRLYEEYSLKAVNKKTLESDIQT
jgi:hypothetical protein